MTRIRLLLSHNATLAMILAVLAGLWLAAQGPAWVWTLVPLGVAAQYFNEYALHRFVFHWPAPRRQWAFDLLYRAHYGHHDFPSHPALFFVPIWVALPVLGLNFAVLWAVLALVGLPYALPIAAAVVLVGGVLTFLGYEWFHMTAHLPVSRTAPEAHVARLHALHHFRDTGALFHVSPGGVVIDRALGTALDTDAAARASREVFIRTLGLAPDDPRLLAARDRFGPQLGLDAPEITRAAQR